MTTPDLDTFAWRKSSYTNDAQGACVEVVDDFPGIVPVRDSKNPSAGHLIIGAASWAALTASLRG
ncbi:DUF397 domain-containing protein [Embleya sp. NPDC020630]|uniref:DUF397 domain-containing protein n=1 Tax=Embleya sp. NPDC020630 TaxID=3363979 RepID=UPI0037B86FF0